MAALNKDADGAPQFVRTVACDKIVGLHLALAITAGVIKQQARARLSHRGTYAGKHGRIFNGRTSGRTYLVPAEGDLGMKGCSPITANPLRHWTVILRLCLRTRQWQNFFTLIDRADLAEAPWVLDPALRSQRIDELYSLLDSVIATATSEHWLSQLSAHDIPCAH